MIEMMSGYGGYFGGGMLLVGVFWLVLVAAAIYFLVKLLSPSDSHPHSHHSQPGVESPEEIVDRLFASGEIDEPTYRSRRAALNEMRKPR